MLICIFIIVAIISAHFSYHYIEQQYSDCIAILKKIENAAYIGRKGMGFDYYKTVQLDVENILQYPELPTGCEVTSLAIVLNYLGHDIDKVSLSDKFLPKGEVGKTHPDEAFIGNPRNRHSYGANAPVLIKTANDYLSHENSIHEVHDVSVKNFDSLLEYINDGYPVIFWGTMYMKEGWYSTKWIIDSKVVRWYAREHCMVLIGYTKDTYIIADPLQGIVEYDKDLVQQRYNELGNQAIVIY